MAGQRFFVILMYSLHVIQGHAYQFSPPELTVKPSVLTETDTVTLSCHSPQSAFLCYFYTLGSDKTETSLCGETLTLTGSTLLWMINQRSPAVVQVKCFYTVKRGDIYSPSPLSGTSFITINNVETELHTTQMTAFSMTAGLTIRPPVSTAVTPIKDPTSRPHVATPATPIKGLTIRPPVSTAVTPIKNLTSRPHVSTPVTPIKGYKGLTVSRHYVSTTVTPIKETVTWKLLVVITTGSVVTVVVFLLVLLCTTSGSKKLKKQEPQKDSDIYHLYDTIPEEPSAPALTTTGVYYTLTFV